MEGPSSVVDYSLTGEPSKAVETMQELIRARAKEMIAKRFYPDFEAEVESTTEKPEGEDNEDAA